MLIGIHGKIGAGKDTLAKMIQLAIDKKNAPFSTLLNLDYIHSSSNILEIASGYKIVKFADALKDIVCILIGCKREQLEDADFKNTTLHSSWTENIQGTDIIGHKIMTVRTLLQRLGTDVMRKHLHDQVWVNALFSKYTPEFKWIITDVRFPNEVKAINNKNGILVKISRSNSKSTHRDPIKVDHISETALDSYFGWDYEIWNNGTLEQLYDIAKQIVKECNLT